MIDLEHDQLASLLSAAERNFDCAIISCDEVSDSLGKILKQLQCPVILVS